MADAVGLQVGLGVVERGGHDLKLFGRALKISKLSLGLSGRATKTNFTAISPRISPLQPLNVITAV